MRKLSTFAIIMALCVATAYAADQGSNDNKSAERRAQRKALNATPWVKQYIIGTNVTFEAAPGIGLGYMDGGIGRFNPGVSFAAHLTRHSGIEVGVNYRASAHSYERHKFEQTQTGRYVNRYISIPIVYKYYGRVLNFVAGVNYDYMFDSIDNPDASPDRNVVGLVIGVTKDIKLGKGMIIEPYLNVNPNSAGLIWLGVGVGLKYAIQ